MGDFFVLRAEELYRFVLGTERVVFLFQTLFYTWDRRGGHSFFYMQKGHPCGLGIGGMVLSHAQKAHVSALGIGEVVILFQARTAHLVTVTRDNHP